MVSPLILVNLEAKALVTKLKGSLPGGSLYNYLHFGPVITIWIMIADYHVDGTLSKYLRHVHKFFFILRPDFLENSVRFSADSREKGPTK